MANSVCPVLIQKTFVANGATDFKGLFLVPLSVASFAAVVLALFFHPPARTQPRAAGAPAH